MKGIYTRSRNSVGTLFLHCARTAEHGVLSYIQYSYHVSNEILGTQSHEFRRTSSMCVVLAYLPKALPKNLSEMSSGDPFGYLRRHVPLVSCDQLLVYTSVLTSGEVKSLVAEYTIPSDLHPCVPPSGLTMNRLLIDKIVATNMSQILKFLMAGGVRVGKGTALAANEVIPHHTTPPLPSGSQILEKSDHQKVVKYENERVLSAKRKAQAAKDRAVGKRAATEGASHRPKKKKTAPFSFSLSDSEADGSNCSGSGTHHSTSPLNTIIPNEAELTTGVDGPILESVNQGEEDTDHNLDNVKDTTKINSPLSEHSSCSQHSNPSDEDTHNVRKEPAHTHASGSTVSSSSGGSHRQAFMRRNPGGNSIGRSLRVYLGCVSKEADLTEKLVAVEKERGDLLDKNREREKSGSNNWKQIGLTETQNQLVDTVQSQNKLSDYHKALNDEYKKSLSDIFNLAIAAGWSEGVKAACSEEEAEVFLATAVDYDPACKTTFMSEFYSLFNNSYPYVEKLVESFRLPLGDLHNMWLKGTGPTLSGNVADAQ
ncbi:hypothetical protein Tco_1013505 [Tanacetum coccineum]